MTTTHDMRRASVAATATILGLTLALTVSSPGAQTGAQEPAPGTAGTPRAGGPGPGGPGGGRGAANPAAALYTEHCASCHGTDLSGGRAPSLFNEQWLATMTDTRLTASIRNGVPAIGMPPFGSLLNDDGPFFVSHYYVDAVQAVRLVREAGGVPVFAHPAAAMRGTIVGDDAINRAIAEVRRLGHAVGADFEIETIPRVGYRMTGVDWPQTGAVEAEPDPRPAISRTSRSPRRSLTSTLAFSRSR